MIQYWRPDLLQLLQMYLRYSCDVFCLKQICCNYQTGSPGWSCSLHVICVSVCIMPLFSLHMHLREDDMLHFAREILHFWKAGVNIVQVGFAQAAKKVVVKIRVYVLENLLNASAHVILVIGCFRLNLTIYCIYKVKFKSNGLRKNKHFNTICRVLHSSI